MKTAEELNALKEEVETLKKKLAGLTEEELKEVSCGHGDFRPCLDCTWPCDESCPYFWQVH